MFLVRFERSDNKAKRRILPAEHVRIALEYRVIFVPGDGFRTVSSKG